MSEALYRESLLYAVEPRCVNQNARKGARPARASYLDATQPARAPAALGAPSADVGSWVGNLRRHGAR